MAKKIYIRLLLAFLIPMAVHFNLKAQNLTGTWEGKLQGSGKSYNYTLYLSSSANGTYSGVLYLKENMGSIIKTTTSTTYTLSTQDLLAPKSAEKAAIIGNFTNNNFVFSPLAIFSAEENTGNWQLPVKAFSYSSSKNKEKLIATDNSNLTLTKKNNDYPGEYAPYATQQFITVNSIGFTNSADANSILFNDKGVLSLKLTNIAPMDLKQLSISINLNKESSGVSGGIISMSLAKQQTDMGSVILASGFDVPADSVHLTLQISCNGVNLLSKKFSLSTTPFYKTDQIVVNKSSAQTLNALQGYYGFNHSQYSSAGPALDQLMADGNKYAAMWAGVFHIMGWGGLSQEEATGLQLAKKSYNAVVSGARNGDAEAQYLMFYAVAMGLTGEPSKDVAIKFLQKAADAGFLPAMYDYATYLHGSGNDEDSYNLFMKCYAKGMQKAEVSIGACYQKGVFVSKDIKAATEWYQKAENFGDPDAMMKFAKLYTDGEDDVEPDASKAVAYATKAANLKNAAAMYFLAKIYGVGKVGVPKNMAKAMELYRGAAALGDLDAMNVLAYTYVLGSGDDVPKDETKGYFWAKKGAEAGNGNTMQLLSIIYKKGLGTEGDIIKSRFWDNQAKLNGVGERDNSAVQATREDMMNIVRNADFSPTYTEVTDYYGNHGFIEHEPDPFSAMIGGALISWAQDRMKPQQDVINGLKYIYDREGKKIYGATLSSTLTTEIYLKKGQTINISAYGTVKLGFMLSGGPGGVSGYKSYCVDPNIPHGAIMAGMKGNWTYIGAEKAYTATADGNLELAINDADYTNNQGYFDLVLSL